MAMVIRFGGAGLTKNRVTANAARMISSVGAIAIQRSARRMRRALGVKLSLGMLGAQYMRREASAAGLDRSAVDRSGGTGGSEEIVGGGPRRGFGAQGPRSGFWRKGFVCPVAQQRGARAIR